MFLFPVRDSFDQRGEFTMHMVVLRRFQIVLTVVAIALCGWMIGRNEGFCTKQHQRLSFRTSKTLPFARYLQRRGAQPNDDDIIDAEIVGRPSTWRRDEAVARGEVAKETTFQKLKSIADSSLSSIKSLFNKVTGRKDSNSSNGKEDTVVNNRIGGSDFTQTSESFNNKPLSTRDFEEFDTLLGSRNPILNPLGNLMRGFVNMALKEISRNSVMSGDDYDGGDRGGSMLANMLQELSGTGSNNDRIVRDAQRKAMKIVLNDPVCRDILSSGRNINDAGLIDTLEASAPLSFSSSTVIINGNVQKQISLAYQLSSAFNSFNFVTVQLTLTALGDSSRIDEIVVNPGNSGFGARRLILR